MDGWPELVDFDHLHQRECDQAVDNVRHLGLLERFQQSKRAERIEFPFANLGGFRSTKHADDQLLSESPLGTRDTTEHDARQLQHGGRHVLFGFVSILLNGSGNRQLGGGTAIVTVTALLAGRLTEVTQDVTLSTSARRRKTNHAIELCQIRFSAFFQTRVIDLQLMERHISSQHVNGSPAKWRNVIEPLVAVQFTQGSIDGGRLFAAQRADVLGVKVKTFVTMFADQMANGARHASLNFGLGWQQFGEIRCIRLDTHGCKIAVRIESFEHAGFLQQTFASAHTVRADGKSEFLLQIRLRQLNGVVRMAAEILVDFLNGILRRVRAVDKEFLDKAVALRVEQVADRL